MVLHYSRTEGHCVFRRYVSARISIMSLTSYGTLLSEVLEHQFTRTTQLTRIAQTQIKSTRIRILNSRFALERRRVSRSHSSLC